LAGHPKVIRVLDLTNKSHRIAILYLPPCITHHHRRRPSAGHPEPYSAFTVRHQTFCFRFSSRFLEAFVVLDRPILQYWHSRQFQYASLSYFFLGRSDRVHYCQRDYCYRCQGYQIGPLSQFPSLTVGEAPL